MMSHLISTQAGQAVGKIWKRRVPRPRVRRLSACLALALLLLAGLVDRAHAAQCMESLCVRFAIGGCEVSITNLISADGSTLGEPTLGLRIAGVECTYQPFSCPMGVGGMLKCFARMLDPFVQISVE